MIDLRRGRRSQSKLAAVQQPVRRHGPPEPTHAPSRQGGVALVTVLLFFAFLSAIAVRLAVNHSLLIAQSQNVFAGDLALNYALGAEDMARQALYEDFTVSGKDIDHLQETWSRALPPFEVDEGGMVEVQVRDRNNCLNLNALTSGDGQAAHAVLVQLLENLGLPNSIADRALDWVDADEIANGFGAEDSEYLLADPPFRTPNAMMGHVSELRLLHGLDEDPTERLRRYLCVLPTDRLVLNVNTASAEALAALLPQADLPRLQALATEARAFQSVGEFVQNWPEFAPVVTSLSTSSEYFQIDVRVQIDTTTVVMSSLARRDASNGRVQVLDRDFGRDFRSRVVVEIEGETGAS